MSQIELGRAADSVSETAPEGFSVEMAAGTPVLTLDGALPAEHLLPGDRIVTRSGASVLSGIRTEPCGGDILLRICAGVLGHDRPEDDLIVPPDQPIFIRDWRARALFGADRVAVPAARLVDGHHVRRERITDVRMVRLSFAQPVVVYAAGLELVAAAARVRA